MTPSGLSPDTAFGGEPLTAADFATAARARLPREVWDYLDGGAGEERTLAANSAAFTRVRLLPRVLTGAGVARTRTRLFGRTWAAPIGIAPCAYHTMVHPEGEPASIRAAGAAGLPFVLSTYSGRPFAQLEAAAAESAAVLWQQVYCFRDRAVTERLVKDAEAAGVEALVLTVDTPHLGRRLRDLRNDFRLPPGIRPANLDEPGAVSPAEHARAANDAALDWTVVDWLRRSSNLPVLLKGVLDPRDAARAVQAGVDGIVVSNHGGRQLDGAPATLEALPAIAAAVAGRIPVLLDGGVRRGTDVLAALALGADAVLLGRPILHGLAVGGEEGVHRVLELFKDELRDAMTLAGVAGVEELEPGLVDASRLDALALPAARPVIAAAGFGAATCGPTGLHRSRLHASLSDPNLDTMAFLNEVADRYPQAVSFAPGRPHEGFFEVEDVFAALDRYLAHLRAQGRSAQSVRTTLYQYGPSAGIIRELIADSLLADEGIETDAAAIVVTVGAQEAMLLVLRALFAEPQDVLLVSTPCYVGIIGAAKLLGIRTATVPERADGLHPEDVRRAVADLRRSGLRPRALYLVPDHSNPSGNTIGVQARRDLLDLARENGLLLLEDSPYRLVSPGQRLPTLKALDGPRTAGRRRAVDSVVVHIGSFAKSAFPGARVGYVLADQAVATGAADRDVLLADELARIKSMVTVNTSALSQAAVAGLLLGCRGRLSELNAAAAAHYGENLRVLLEELAKRFPDSGGRAEGPAWNEPRGGFFLTLSVPFRADEHALARSAQEYGVLWTPMAYFHPDGGGERQIRLSFSALTPAEIREGVARLARFVAAESSRPAGPA